MLYFVMLERHTAARPLLHWKATPPSPALLGSYQLHLLLVPFLSVTTDGQQSLHKA